MAAMFRSVRYDSTRGPAKAQNRIQALQSCLGDDVVKFIFVSLMGLSLLGSQKFPPYPDLPEEGNATLSFEGINVDQFNFIPDGVKCGGAQPVPDHLNPLMREDKRFVMEANKRSALQFIWVSGFSGACWVIASINPVADGRYRIEAGENRKVCWLDVIPLDEKSAEGFELVRMQWKGFKLPSECRPQDKKRPWPP